MPWDENYVQMLNAVFAHSVVSTKNKLHSTYLMTIRHVLIHFYLLDYLIDLQLYHTETNINKKNMKFYKNLRKTNKKK